MLPRISIITPTFNHAAYIESTILSVLEQQYPNAQYVIMDGGSTDGSVEILRKYASNISYWESKPDRGQSHAINKGLRICDGEIVNWLCSDDQLAPGALHRVAEAFEADPQTDIVAGRTRYRHLKDGAVTETGRCDDGNVKALPAINEIAQPSCFFRRRLLDRPQPVAEDLHYTMDWELWCYFRSKGAKWHFVDDVLSTCLITGMNKSLDQWGTLAEVERIYRQYAGDRAGLMYILRHLWLPLARRSRDTKLSTSGQVCWRLSRLVDRMANALYGREAAEGLRQTYWLYGGRA